MNEEKKMTNCPKCQKPVLNEGVFTSAARFNMRCPWCQATLEINVKPKIITEVIKLANGDPYRPTPNQGTQPPIAFGKEPIRGLGGETAQPQEGPRFKLVGYLYQDDEKAPAPSLKATGQAPDKPSDKT